MNLKAQFCHQIGFIEQKNEIKKSIPDLDEKFNNLDEKFSKDPEVLKKNLRNETFNKANLKAQLKISGFGGPYLLLAHK